MPELQHRGDGQATARGVAADDDVLRRVTVVEQRTVRGDAILDPRGERMLRGETILRQQRVDPGGGGNVGGEGAMGVAAAERVRAAVQVKKDFTGQWFRRPIPLRMKARYFRWLDGDVSCPATEPAEEVEALTHAGNGRLANVQLLDIPARKPADELGAAADAHAADISARGT